MNDAKAHWESVYRKKSPDKVSWYAPHLTRSLGIIRELNLGKDTNIIDVGGGASTLPDDLLAEGFRSITILDISQEALNISKGRLKEKAGLLKWVEADITRTALESGHYGLWHDRAVFHFLTDASDRRAYVENLGKALGKRGYVLIATFGPKGPPTCSGLEVVRHSAESLEKELGKDFVLEKHLMESHETPFNTSQEFLYGLFRKR